MTMLVNALIYLFAAVISVPIAKKLGLGSVLGYLIAGVLIGPFVLHLVGEQSEVMHFAEFGVVMMLFLIGLELRPNRLWQLRKPILGMGGFQVLATALLITVGVVVLSDLAWQTSLAIGLAVALSSTAIVLQSLSEKGLLKTQAGNNAFSVLLFQDIAVIPILALFPLLAVSGQHVDAEHHSSSLIDDLPVWAQISISLFTIIAVIFAGKYFAAPIFRIIAETRLNEIFTAFALLVVIAIAALMLAIGLSPALGTFLAGVVLAESEFRHEMEINLEPFKGLLLGLFFITVGASIDFGLLTQKPMFIISCVLALFAVKIVVLVAISLIFKMERKQLLIFTMALAQGGEFAFVLVQTAFQSGVFTLEVGNALTLVVALSMLISPLLFVGTEKYLSRAGQKSEYVDSEEMTPTCQVILAGYGRFGQIVGRLLTAQGFHLTILDHSPGQIELVRRFGNKVFYGDAARKGLLEAAGAEEAVLLVVAVDEPSKTLEIIDVAKKHFPHLKILARAMDRRHAYEIMRRNIQGFRRETFDSALFLGVEALKQLGQNASTAQRAGQLFAKHDEESLAVLAEIWGDDAKYGVAVRKRLEDLKHVLENDEEMLQFKKPKVEETP